MSDTGTLPPPRLIEIIGGGLAGLSLGIALRQARVPVTIHEAGDYPRHRACGEFITGLAPATIDRLGLAPALTGALVHRHVEWFLPGQQSRTQRLPAPALGLSRHTLDTRLAERFEQLGGQLHRRARVVELSEQPGRVFALGRRRATSSRWLGLKVHARDLPLRQELELHLGAGGYVGLARIEDDQVNICGLFQRHALSAAGPELLVQYVRAIGLPELAARLGNADLEAESFCAVAALEFDRAVEPTSPSGSPNAIRLGDAAAMIPPFTGNGMAMAFQSAEVALAPLVAYADGSADWAETCAVTQAGLRRRFRVRLASAGALHPWLIRRTTQRWLGFLGRARLLPLRALYTALH